MEEGIIFKTLNNPVEIIGNVYYFNGKKIKFKGVNHHDTHLTKGWSVDFEDDTFYYMDSTGHFYTLEFID